MLKARFLQARNNVDHTVDSVAYIKSVDATVAEADQAVEAVGVIDSQGAFWWNGKQADLHYIWKAHEVASKALKEQQSAMPEDLFIQRGADPKDTTRFRDPTEISCEMEQGINHDSVWKLWQDVLQSRSKPFLLAEATDELPQFPWEQKPKPTAKCYAAFRELEGVVTSLHASRGGDDTTMWSEMYAAGEFSWSKPGRMVYCTGDALSTFFSFSAGKKMANRACSQQFFLFVGAMLSFREAYTKAACSEQPVHTDADERKQYHEDYFDPDQNKLLNAMLDRADA